MEATQAPTLAKIVSGPAPEAQAETLAILDELYEMAEKGDLFSLVCVGQGREGAHVVRAAGVTRLEFLGALQVVQAEALGGLRVDDGGCPGCAACDPDDEGA